MPKISPKIMQIGIDLYYGCTSLTKKFMTFYENQSIHVHKLYRSLTLFYTTQLKL
jgi:hypothetical protein